MYKARSSLSSLGAALRVPQQPVQGCRFIGRLAHGVWLLFAAYLSRHIFRACAFAQNENVILILVMYIIMIYDIHIIWALHELRPRMGRGVSQNKGSCFDPGTLVLLWADLHNERYHNRQSRPAPCSRSKAGIPWRQALRASPRDGRLPLLGGPLPSTSPRSV